MIDTLVLRAGTAGDAAAIARVIAASFEQYRGRLVPESGAFRETAENIAAELERGAGALVAERNGELLGCVLVEEKEGDLYFGRLSVVPTARGRGLAKRLIDAVEAEARPARPRRRPSGCAHRPHRQPAPVPCARLPRDFARGPSGFRASDLDQHAQAARLIHQATPWRGRAA